MHPSYNKHMMQLQRFQTEEVTMRQADLAANGFAMFILLNTNIFIDYKQDVDLLWEQNPDKVWNCDLSLL